ncbi:MAG: PAS domain S-box protein [Deltaproteobacteria bacterium]|nr:PAS domain S-box protein [Deltaproteobacteria bacterium]
MGSRIRTKLLKTMALALIPLAALAVLGLYNQSAVHYSVVKVNAVSREVALVVNVHQAFNSAIMPPNDYIITGKGGYAVEFRKYSSEMERLLKEADSFLDAFDGEDETVAEEKKILKELKESWGNVRDISARIFSIQRPVGSREAADLMEEMDYRWGANAVALLDRWHKIDEREFAEASRKAEAAWRNAWVIMGGGVAATALLTMFLAYYYSGVFVNPIERLREHSLKIASGDFKARASIRTGDELEDLSDAMDRMSSELSALYRDLEQKVEERTRELYDAHMDLKAGEERYRDLFNGTNDAIFVHPVPGEGAPMKFTDVNEAACMRFGYSREELLELSPYSIDAPGHEAEREAAIREMVQNGHAIFEMALVAKDGGEIPVEISTRVFELNGAPMGLSIVRDISERKKGEDLLKERIEELEMFRKLTLKRELRLREMKDRIEALEMELKEAGRNGLA